MPRRECASNEFSAPASADGSSHIGVSGIVSAALLLTKCEAPETITRRRSVL